MRHRHAVRSPLSSALLMLALAALALLASPIGAAAQGTTAVTGIVFLSGAPTLPSNASVTIQLADVTQPGVPGKVITERVFNTGGAQSPFSFTLPYSAQQINASNRYIIQGNILVSGQILYQTTQPFAVITAGNPTSNLQITMSRVATGGLPQSSAGTQPLLLAGALLLAALAAMAIRRRMA